MSQNKYIMQDLTSRSEITPRPSLSLSTQGKADHFSQDKVFPLMLKEIVEKAEELESLGKQCSILNSRLRSLSNTEIEENGDLLYKKGIFLDKLTQALEDVDSALDGPKYTLHCYNQFSSLLETRCNESRQDIQQKTELFKEQKQETSQIISQEDIFANLVEEENEDLIKKEHRQASLQFEEAKADLVTVINISYPDEEEKKQFLLVTAKLVEAHINNLDSIEDQYVEVLPPFLNNRGLRCLINGFVVVEHPHYPTKFRLSVDD